MTEHFNSADVDRLYAPMMLCAETADDFSLLRESLQRHYQPRNFIENILVADLVTGEQEILRYRRAKERIIKLKTPEAIRQLLRLTRVVGYQSDEMDCLTQRFFTSQKVRNRVGRILRGYGMDEGSIDAEALRLSLGEIELIDRRLSELERRRSKIFDQIEVHRAGLAQQVVGNPALIEN